MSTLSPFHLMPLRKHEECPLIFISRTLLSPIAGCGVVCSSLTLFICSVGQTRQSIRPLWSKLPFFNSRIFGFFKIMTHEYRIFPYKERKTGLKTHQLHFLSVLFEDSGVGMGHNRSTNQPTFITPNMCQILH